MASQVWYVRASRLFSSRRLISEFSVESQAD